MPHLTVTTPATIPGELYDRAMEFARIADPADEQTFRGMVAAAVSDFEAITGRALFTQTRKMLYEGWQNALALNAAPVSAVTSVSYYDEDDTEQTVATGDYTASLTETNPRVVFNTTFDRPGLSANQPNPVSVTMTCGYGSEVDDVPEAIINAICLVASRHYDNRSGDIAGELHQIRRALFTGYRINHMGLT
jgi:uncharacterized phiE125 gp8 family phage protein